MKLYYILKTVHYPDVVIQYALGNSKCKYSPCGQKLISGYMSTYTGDVDVTKQNFDAFAYKKRANAEHMKNYFERIGGELFKTDWDVLEVEVE